MQPTPGETYVTVRYGRRPVDAISGIYKSFDKDTNRLVIYNNNKTYVFNDYIWVEYEDTVV